jgi:hypothetical protein
MNTYFTAYPYSSLSALFAAERGPTPEAVESSRLRFMRGREGWDRQTLERNFEALTSWRLDPHKHARAGQRLRYFSWGASI